MKALLVSILLVLALCAEAASYETVTFNLAEDWDEKFPLPDGWTGNGLSQSSTYNNGAAFGGGAYYLQSPSFPGVVTKVTLRLCCSIKDPIRILTLYPIGPKGDLQEGLQFDPPETVKSYENQSKDIERYGVDAFRIGMNTGGSGNWYVLWVTIEYDPSRPVEHPVEPEPEPFHLGLTNGWKVSEFIKGESGCLKRTADFSSIRFEGNKKTAAWTNGVSVDSFYAYSTIGACTQIRLAATNSTYSGIYSAITNDNHALALLGVEDLAMSMILPGEFDQDRNLSELTVGYDAWQFTARNQTTLAFSACAVDELAAADSADWITSDVYTSGVSSVSRFIRFPPKLLNKARYMCFRWSVPKQSGSSILGITDLQVTTRSRSDGCLLMIR